MTPSKLILEALARAGGPSAETSPERNRDCARCRKVEDAVRRDVPDWRPGQCESWIGTGGRRYWSGTCARCAELERQQRISAAVAEGKSRDGAEREFGVNRGLLARRKLEREAQEREAAE